MSKTSDQTKKNSETEIEEQVSRLFYKNLWKFGTLFCTAFGGLNVIAIITIYYMAVSSATDSVGKAAKDAAVNALSSYKKASELVDAGVKKNASEMREHAQELKGHKESLDKLNNNIQSLDKTRKESDESLKTAIVKINNLTKLAKVTEKTDLAKTGRIIERILDSGGVDKLTADILEVERKIKELQSPVEWKPISKLDSGWIGYSGDHGNPEYCITRDGFLKLRGLVKLGSIGKVVFSLKGDFTFSKRYVFAVLGNDMLSRVDIFKNGDVIVLKGQNKHPEKWISLDGISVPISRKVEDQ